MAKRSKKSFVCYCETVGSVWLYRLSSSLAPLISKGRICGNNRVNSYQWNTSCHLAVLATGDAQKAIAAKYIISQSTMCRIITEIRDAIWTVLKRKEFLTCPFMEEEWKGISQGLD